MYRDKVTNEPKGDATVTYEDPHAALAAVEWFNNKDFHGSIIGVFIAESKNKDDHSYNSGNQVNDVGDPGAASDLRGLEEDPLDMNGSAGRGRGRGDAAGKAWQQDGDWLCPNTRSVMWDWWAALSFSFILFSCVVYFQKPLLCIWLSYMLCGSSCSNVNFAFRGVCNRCGSARPSGVSGSGAGAGGRGRGRGGPDSAGHGRSVGAPTGLFGPNDWPCPM